MDASWQVLPLDWCPLPKVLAETLGGGQAFRWKYSDGIWAGQWDKHAVHLKQDAKQRIFWKSPTHDPQMETALSRYLAADTNFDQMADVLPWRSDPVLADALNSWQELRILKQPFGETLLAFLCSSTKRISQIAIMMETLALRLGEEIGTNLHALPSWQALHECGEHPLRKAGLGYRARYVSATAAVIADKPGWLKTVEGMPYGKAKAALMTLPGVGAKIADCVLLFGAGRMEAFPVDTWILKAMAHLYGLEDWKPEHIVQFGQTHFGTYAGYAQQVLFANIRR